MATSTERNVANALIGRRLTKQEFLTIVREAACRLKVEDFRAGWLEQVMRVVNSLEDEK